MCYTYEHAEKAASVEKTYYVGEDESYGKMSEESMMKEIMARGPILYDFMAGYEFMMYS